MTPKARQELIDRETDEFIATLPPHRQREARDTQRMLKLGYVRSPGESWRKVHGAAKPTKPAKPVTTSNPIKPGPLPWPKTPAPKPADSVDKPVTTGVFETVGGKEATGIQRAINANIKLKEKDKR